MNVEPEDYQPQEGRFGKAFEVLDSEDSAPLSIKLKRLIFGWGPIVITMAVVFAVALGTCVARDVYDPFVFVPATVKLIIGSIAGLFLATFFLFGFLSGLLGMVCVVAEAIRTIRFDYKRSGVTLGKFAWGAFPAVLGGVLGLAMASIVPLFFAYLVYAFVASIITVWFCE